MVIVFKAILKSHLLQLKPDLHYFSLDYLAFISLVDLISSNVLPRL